MEWSGINKTEDGIETNLQTNSNLKTYTKNWPITVAIVKKETLPASLNAQLVVVNIG